MKVQLLPTCVQAPARFILSTLVLVCALFAWSPEALAQCGACDQSGMFTFVIDATGAPTVCQNDITVPRSNANPECYGENNCVVIRVLMHPEANGIILDFSSSGLGNATIFDEDGTIIASGNQTQAVAPNVQGGEVCVTICKNGQNDINIDFLCTYSFTDVEVVSITNPTSPLVPGTTERFDIVVRNNSAGPALSPMVNFDLVDMEWSLDSMTASSVDWTFLLSGSAMRVRPMPGNAVETITVWARIPSDASHVAGGNPPLGPAVASIGLPIDDDEPANNQLSTNIASRVEAALTIQKKALTTSVVPGGLALFEINVCNNGPSDAAGVAITDVPGANIVPGSVVLGSSATNMYIPAGECRSVIAVGTVEPTAPIASSFSNTASINITNFNDGPGASLAPVVTVGAPSTATGTVANSSFGNADVQMVSVTCTTLPITPGAIEDFQIVVRNNGGADAVGANVNFGVYGPDYTLTFQNGAGNWIWATNGSFSRINAMPAGATETIGFSLTFASDANLSMPYAFSSPVITAIIAASNPDPVPGNNYLNSGASSQSVATLTLEKTLLTPQVAPGGTAMYEITVCNNGPSDIDGIAISDVPGLNLDGATLVLSPDADDLYLAAGQCVDVMASVRLSVSAPVGASFVNAVSISTANAEDGPGATLPPIINLPGTVTNSAGVVVYALPYADIAVIAVRHPNTPLVPGTVERFEVDVRNNSGTEAYGVILNNVVLGVNGTVVNGSTGAWVSQSNGNVFVRTNPMPSDSTETVFFDVLVNSDAHYNGGGATHWATATSSNPDPNPANNTRVNALNTQLQSTLTIDKKLLTPRVAPGGTAIYEIEICNQGPSDVRGITIDDVPGVNLVAGTLVFGPNVDNLTIPANQCMVVTATVQVSPSAVVGTTFSNTATVNTSGLNDGYANLAPVINTPSDTDGTGLVVDALPNADVQVLAVRHTNSPIVPGTVERFEVDVRNNGGAPAYGMILNNLLQGLDGTVVNGSTGVWTSQSNGNVFVRSAPMPPSTTETVFFEVRINSDAHYNTSGAAHWATVTASNPDPNINNNTLTNPLTAQLQSTLTIDKKLLTPRVAPGGTALYEIEICNQGPSDVRGISINDVPGVNLVAGTLVFGPNVDNLTIPANQCMVVTASVQVSPSALVGSTFSNTATVDVSGLNDGFATLAPVINAPSDTDGTGVVVDALPAADVQVLAVRHNNSPIVPGTVEHFEVDVRNNGGAPAYGTILNNLLQGLDGTVVNGSTGFWTSQSNGNVFVRSAPMPPNTTETVFFEVRINSDAHYNTSGAAHWATVTASNPDPNINNNTLTNPLTAQLQSTLTIDKKLLTPRVAPGGTALYEIEICNQGPSDVRGITIDDVPGVNLVAGTLVFGPNVDNLTIPANQCMVVTASIQVSPSALVGSTFSNTATVDVSGLNDGFATLVPVINTPTDTDATGIVVDALPNADVQVLAIRHINSPIVPGTVERFEVDVRNNGGAPAYGTILNNLLQGLDGTVVNGSTGFWTSQSNGNVFVRSAPMPPNTTETVFFEVRINSDAHYNTSGAAHWATVTASNPDPNINNNTLTNPLTAQLQSTLTIDKKLLTPRVAPGGTAIYEIEICNQGPSDVRGITIDDVPGVNLVAGTLVFGPNVDNLTIPANQCMVVTASIQVSPSALVGSTFSNTATVDVSGLNDGFATLVPVINTPTDTDATGIVVDALPNADVQVLAVRHTNSPIVPGTVEHFEVDVRNNGGAPAYGAILNNVLLGLDGTVVNGPTGPWVSQSNGNVFTRSTPMPPSTTETIGFDVLINSNAHYIGGGATHWATVTASNPDPIPSNNTLTNPLTAQLQSTLTIDKKLLTPRVAPGGTAIYEIEICNQGPSDVRGITIDDVPGVNLVAGTLVFGPNVDNLTIPANQCMVVTASIQVSPSALVGSTFSNTATVDVSGLNDGFATLVPVINTPSDTDATGIVVDALPNADVQVLAVRHTNSPIVPGTVEHFEVDVRNNGGAPAYGAILNNVLLGLDGTVVNGPTGPWVSQSNGNVFTRSTPMPPSTTETIGFDVLINSNAHYIGGGAIHWATVTASNPDPIPSNNTMTNPLTAQLQSTLTIDKKLLTPRVAPGGTAIYEIEICNQGPSDVRGITIDDVPGVNLVAGTLVFGPNVDNLTIPANQCMVVTASIQVSPSALVGSTFSNTATVDVSGLNDGFATLVPVINTPTDTDATGIVVDALPNADVQVLAVRHTNSPVVPGTVEHFEVDVRNNGGAPAYGAILNNVLLGLDGTVVNGPTGPWVSQSNGNVFTRSTPMPPGTTETIGFDVRINSDAHYNANFATHWATVTASNPDPIPSNNTLTNPLTVQLQSTLTIDKKLLTPRVAPGGTAIYEIEICNQGPSDVRGITIDDVPGVNLVAGTLVFGPNVDNLTIPANQCMVVTASIQVSPSALVGSTFSNTATVNVSGLNDGFATLVPVINTPSDTDDSGVVVDALPNADVQVLAVRHTNSPIVPGTVERFEVDVRNNGGAPAYGTILNNLLQGLDGTVVNGSTGFWTSQSNGNVFVRSAPMPPNTTETVFFEVRINSDAHYNTSGAAHWATVTASNPDPNINNNTLTNPLTAQLQSTLTIDKKLLTPRVAPGGTAIYEIEICNQGPSDVRGITIDDVPGVNLVAGTLVFGPNVDNLTIPANQCMVVTATVQVSPSALVGSTFSNTATVDVSGLNDGFATLVPVINTPSDTDDSGIVIDPLPSADVQVLAVRHTNSPVVPGTIEHFEVDVRNNGGAPAYGAILNNVLLGLNGTVVNGPTGPWVSQSNGNVFTRSTPMPPGTTETIGFDVRINSDAHYNASFATHWATITASNPDPIPSNNTLTNPLTVQLQSTLTIDKKLLTPRVAPGGTAIYEIEICNLGPSDVRGITIDDVPGVNLVAGTLVFGPNVDNMTIPAYQCMVVTATVQVSPSALVGSTFSNTATVNVSGLNDGFATLAPVINAPSDTDDEGIVVDQLPTADVEAVSLTLTSGPLVPGTSETFVITVRNNGPSPAYGATVVFNLLDTEWSIDNSIVPVGWSFFGNGTFIRTSPMPSGAMESLTIDLRIPSNAAYAGNDVIGPISMTIAASNPDPNTANNTLINANIPSQVQANLTIDKQVITSTIAPGGTAIFEIVVCNTGPSDVRGISIDDVVGANLNGATLILSPDADDLYIPAGQCVDILASAQVFLNAIPGNNFVNTATVNADNADQGITTLVPIVNEPSDSDNGGLVIDPIPAADIEVVSVAHNSSPVTPGTTEVFTVVVRNNGPSIAYGATMVFNLYDINWVINNDIITGSPGWNFAGHNTFLHNSPLPGGALTSFEIHIDIPSNAHYVATDPLGIFRAIATASNPDPNGANNEKSLFLQTQAISDLTIEKTLLTPEVAPGSTAIYEIVVCNNGPSDVRGISVADIPGINLDAASLVLSPDAFDLYVPAGQCVDVLAMVRVADDAAVDEIFCNAAFANTEGVDAGPGSTMALLVNSPSTGDVCGTVSEYLPTADVDIFIENLTPNPVASGGTMSFNVRVVNNGPAPAEHVVVHVGIMGTQYTLVGQGVPANWTFSSTGLTLSRSGSMPAGTEEVITILVQIPLNEVPDGNLLIASVSAANPDPDAINFDSEFFDIIDNTPPTYLNCPTTMVMVAADPDQCSAKVNWAIPVAIDNDLLISNVQIGGPLNGSIIPVGPPQVVTYKATDRSNNMSTCTFLVQVVDTEKPEFDADIIMPNDTTVNCHQVPTNCVYHGPLICTPLTNNDVNDNCTPSNLLNIAYTQVSTQDPNPAVCAHYNYMLTRTWTITDQSGNQLIHVQKITVQDTTAPVALCKSVTVILDKNGLGTIVPGSINNGSYDNCAPAANLTYTIAQGSFTCANLGQNIVTLIVTDPCGNSSTCQATVTVIQGIGLCTPAYSVKTSCLDNATTIDNGQFEDIITVKSIAMQTWRLTSNIGFFTASSPAPPAAGVVMPVGTQFTMGNLDGIDNDNDGTTDEADEMIFYTLRGRFTECVGYSISISNSTNFGNAGVATTATISNKACYPTPYFLNLDGPFCLNTPPFQILVGEYNNAVGIVSNITVNGVPTNIFNAGVLGEGFHTVTATFDAGTATQNLVINGVQVGGSMADALADPGCKQTITKTVQVIGTPTTVACNDLVHISLDADCVVEVTPDMVLEGTYYCFDDYIVVLSYPQGTTQFNPPNRVDASHINKVIMYTLSHNISGNMCWGTVKVEDKLAPILTCPADLTIACSESTGVAHTGNVGIQDCSTTTTQIDNSIQDDGDCSNPRQIITRTFIVTDAWGNQASCTQVITVEPFDLDDVIFPADITLNCEDVNSNPGSTLPAATGNPSINGASVTGSILCDAKVNYTDTYYEGCEGTYTILRAWSVLSDCLPVGPDNPVNATQRIEVEDNGGPQFSCPADVTVSVDPYTCCATAALPDIIVSEGCSYILDLEAKVTGVDPNSGNITTFTVPGSLADFPGNNYWNPDTLAVFPFTQCLPNGNVYLVRYTANDQCGNASYCEFNLTVMDLVPPAVSCDEFTQVSLGVDGTNITDATTFDDGTYDNCCLEGFEVRRMLDGPCDLDTLDDEFAPTVEFCCADLGDTVTVVFRAYDCTGNYNDCMVQVFVDDKLKPTCNAPANVTVSCENFDPTLWAYGAASATDNCCMDTITTVVILTNFDTTCNKGTITRRFTAVDCAGQTSTCTQRIVVNYEQDYFVRFPNDKILYACDSSFFDQPTFFGEDCELLAVSYHDELFTVVPDACYKIERTWTIINWCTHNPNLDCIYVPNPNPNANVNSPANLPGPIVSAPGTTGAWAPTVVRINPTDPQPTNYSTFWEADANCYIYKQIIKVIDTQDPVVTNCPASPLEVCDLTPNDALFWNEMYWWDNTIGTHDLCEAPTDLTITATDSCGGENVNIRYLLFLDLDQNGDMETVISSTNLPGYNNVQFGNANTPNYLGGTPRSFDERPVTFNQKYGFTLQTTINAAAQTKTASVRWNTTQSPNTYTVPQLPYGTHKIKWIVEDGCGNETICEYEFVVKDCKAPTVVCLNGISVNIMPTDMIVLWAADFLQYTEDNCTPADQVKVAIRRKGAGTGFPLNPDGTPQTSVTFTCADLGTQFVELWGEDAAGNADFCETYVIVQDNAGNCSNANVTIAGALETETNNGLQDAEVELNGLHPALPPINMFEQSISNGTYMFGNALPVAANYSVMPTKDDDHLNGVTTYDLVLINKHILGIEAFDSPYKVIAADANNSKSVTTFDIAEFRKLILGIYPELPNNSSWRFVDNNYTFPNPDNPFAPAFPESKSVADVQANQLGDDFVAMKIGDVNGTAITNTLMSTDDRTNGTLLFDLEDRKLTAGETVTVHFTAAEKVTGYQFTLGFAGLEVMDVAPGTGMKADNFAVFADAITTSFDANVEGAFSITFRAKQAGSLRNMLSVSSRITKAEAYSLGGDRLEVALRYNGKDVQGVGFEVYQNQPNPWINRTIIGFHLPEAAEVTLNVFDETGRLLFNQTGDFAKGHNAFTLDKALVNTTGVLYYQVMTGDDSATMKMIQTK